MYAVKQTPRLVDSLSEFQTLFIQLVGKRVAAEQELKYVCPHVYAIAGSVLTFELDWQWGPDVSLQFLHKNNLVLLVRSHEMVDEGFKYLHHDKVITLFSASNYCGTNENQGAVLCFADGTDLAKPQAIQYFAEAYVDEGASAAATSSSTESLCKEETLQKLREVRFPFGRPKSVLDTFLDLENFPRPT